MGRFNERFLLSLTGNSRCIVCDDEFNILPISLNVMDIKPVSAAEQMDDKGNHILTAAQAELQDLITSMKDVQPAGSLVAATRTLDQARAVLTFIDAISDKSLRNTVVLTAARYVVAF